MARPIRLEYPGAVYHVTARGNERRRTFRDDADRRQFIGTLAQAVEQQGLRLHGYCLTAESLSSPDRDVAGQFGSRDGLAADDLHGAFQPPPSAQRPSLSGAV